MRKASIGETANAVNRQRQVNHTQTSGFYRNVAKRGLDILLVVLSLPGILPLIFVLAVLVSREGGKPFYRQKRIGMNGRVFYMWKLRSMVHEADKVLETYLQDNPKMRAQWKTKQKLINDPRVTSLGRFLRKSSLDELPQLFNVLKGEMSLVGPRPMMEDQKSLYPGSDYYEVRPGITGFWQISDRNETSFADRAFYDARYNRELSFKTDFITLVATVRVVLRGTGH
ncbi:sugar transferase [Tateyamaria sp. ANG-S1]|nr:sugar transferase [Tateyamaria sp. ANG-S1]